MTQSDLFQANRPTPFDVVVTFDKALAMLEEMKAAGIIPRTMDRMKGQYRLRGYAPAGLLARLFQREELRPRSTNQNALVRLLGALANEDSLSV